MGWEDRSYYRDRNGVTGSPLYLLFNGTVPLFTAFGIRVRAHAMLFWLMGLVIVLDHSKGYPLKDRAISMALLFGLILLHEFGHCFAARSVGGDAEDILMWPLGGLAFASPPRRPWPTFVTVAGGPLVNVIVCLLSAVVLYLWQRVPVPLNPFNLAPQFYLPLLAEWIWWLYGMSYILLLFNLLPIFPLDGGQIMQSILWPPLGYYRSMRIACIVGLVGAVVFGLYGLVVHFSLMLISLAIVGFMYCRQKLQMLAEMGPEGLDDAIDYSANLSYASENAARRRKLGRVGRWKLNRARRQARAEAQEQDRIDTILAKVSSQGMNSLTRAERQALKRATERQRQRDLQDSRKY